MFYLVKNPPANDGNADSIPGSGRPPGEGNGNSLQDSCLENPMDRGLPGKSHGQRNLAGYSPCMGLQKVRHNLVSKQQQTIISSVQFSRSVVSDSLRPHESQHTRPPCPSPTLEDFIILIIFIMHIKFVCTCFIYS